MSSGSRSPSPWGQGGSRASNPTVGSPPPASSLSSFSPTSPQSLEPSPASSQTSLKVHSTSPPSKPQLPPSPRTAQPVTPSILLNPLPANHRSNSPPSASTSLLKRLPGKRRQSLVTVEVHHSPPPAHFYQSQELEHSREDLQEVQEEERVGRSTTINPNTNPYSYNNMSPPRPDFSGMRSRSASPISTPRSSSPVQQPQRQTSSSQFLSPTSTSPTSTASSNSPSSSSFVPLTSIMSNRSSSSQASSNGSGSCIRFAPLPQGKRPNRSNSISLGVASRARMINAQGGQPNVQQARYAGPLQWYEGGEMPQDVYTWRDAQRGISKIWKKVNGGKEVASPPPSSKGRSESITSTTSGGSLEEAKRMEREAKSGGKGEVEHVEETTALVEEENEDEELEEGSEDTESEVMAPRTPPEGTALGLSGVGEDDVESEKERRRKEKGKGKAVQVERVVRGGGGRVAVN